MTGPLEVTAGPVSAAASVSIDRLIENHRTRVAADRRAKMRARLVTAIMELWPQAQTGISIVIDDVVRTAAVSRGSFYKHFASLEEALEAIGRHLADEMTIGLMPVYDTLPSPVHRLAAGFQLFQWRAAFDPVWARFVSRTDHLFHDPELLANLMVDLENGRSAGLYAFESVELAANFVIGATLGGIRRIAASKTGACQIAEQARLVLRGLGLNDRHAREAIASTHAHLIERAPGRLAWWDEHPHRSAGKSSTGT